MSAFKFRLQSVLELREKQEQQTAAKLADAESAADEARLARQALEVIQQNNARALHAAHANAPTIGQLKTIGYVIDQLNTHIVDAQTKVVAAEQDVSRARSDLTTALQARRVLSRLRERHLATWRVDDKAADLRAMDELALSRFARRTDTDTPETDEA
ncbi:MAG TPA: flagellar export protein FliJ [Gemmatimonadaceae bacterium]|jgi:flagellar FliJ protein|nr:flagellar export protein FliJ [Gemmatimonadaceae bacterium]